MFRLPLAAVLLVVSTVAAADGVALIEFENPTNDPVEAAVGDKKYMVKAKSSQKVFLSPGRYECAWGDQKLVCNLKHGDITVIPVANSKTPSATKKEDEKPGIVVVDPKDILGQRPPPKDKGVDPQSIKNEDKDKRPDTPTPVDTARPKDQDAAKPITKKVDNPVGEQAKPRPPPEKPKPINCAVIKFLLPTNAVTMWIDSDRKEINGREEIICHTPTLQYGQSYYYDITVELKGGTRYIRRVFVFANQTTTVDFR